MTKIAEIQEFMHSRDSLLRCLDLMPVGISILKMVLDSDGCAVDMEYVYCNEACANMEGMGEVDVHGMHFYRDLFPVKDRRWLVLCGMAALRGEEKSILYLREDIGQFLQVSVSQPAYGYCQCMMRNVSSDFNLESSLVDYQNAIETVLNNDLTAAFTYDIDERVMYNNFPGANKNVLSKDLPETLDNVPWSLAQSGFVREEDLDRILEFLDKPLLSNSSEAELELQLNFSMSPNEPSWQWYALNLHRYPTVYKDHRRAVCSVRKIQKEVDLRNMLRRKADMDLATGVYNRQAAFEFITSHLVKSDKSCVLCLFDLDNLKTVNDTWGHMKGDEVIQFFANLLLQVMQGYLVFRLGGDEFAAFGQGMSPESVDERCAAVLRGLDGQTRFEFPIRCSAGAAWKSGSIEYEDLYRNADKALYMAKDAGRHTWRKIVMDGLPDGGRHQN